MKKFVLFLLLFSTLLLGEKMGSYKDLLAPKSATYKEAIAKYEEFTKTDLGAFFGLDEEFYITDEYGAVGIEKFEKTSIKLIEKIETENGFKFPKELKELYTNFGGFEINEAKGLTVFEPKDNFFFLNEFTNCVYEDTYTKYSNTLSMEQLKELKDNFFFFAIGSYDDDGGSSRMFYFHKSEGYFAEIELLTANYPVMTKETFPAFFSKTAPKSTLDELIANQINRVILYLLTTMDLVNVDDLDEEDKKNLEKSEIY
ncbi:MAG: SMI1/KNR4 family protein [Campylobacteraceae bacterium]